MSVRSTVEMLKQIPLFADIDEAHLQTLVFSSDELVVPQGRTVFEAGDPSTSAIIIKEGDGVVVDGETGSVIALAGPGSIFGEQSMIAGLPYRVTLNAKTELIGIVIEQAVFMRLCSEFPEVGQIVLNVLSKQLDKSSQELSAVQDYFQVQPVDELIPRED
ncbi:MAG: Crp/Fnr family transcriptional regulator [Anderseniella sp.]